MTKILDIIFPKTCYGCSKAVDYLCSDCQTLLQHLSLKNDTPPHVEGRLSLFKYHHPLKSILSDLKYQFVTDLVDVLVSLASDQIHREFPNLLKYWQQSGFVLVPIPLHWYRQNWRGFNQSQLLASALASKLDLKYHPDFLVRSKYTSPQVKTRSKKLRATNISHAFSLNTNHRLLTTNHFILFDDVYTTGSTLNSASLVFPKNTHIWYLTLAG